MSENKGEGGVGACVAVYVCGGRCVCVCEGRSQVFFVITAACVPRGLAPHMVRSVTSHGPGRPLWRDRGRGGEGEGAPAAWCHPASGAGVREERWGWGPGAGHSLFRPDIEMYTQGPADGRC